MSTVESVNGKTGVVELPGLTSEGELPGSVVKTPAAPFLFGVNGSYNHYATWVSANVLGDRGGNVSEGDGLTILYNATAEQIAKLVTYVGERLAKGQTPFVVIDTGTASIGSITPAAYTADFMTIVKAVLAAHPTAEFFEIINEPWYKGAAHRSNGGTYGEICAAVYTAMEEALAKKELGAVTSLPNLLVTAYGGYTKGNPATEASEGESLPSAGHGWIADLLAAWPSGKTKINGFCAHPYYGTPYSNTNEQTVGFQQLASLHQQLVAQGCTGASNVYATEVNYKRESETTAQEEIQATRMRQYLEQAWRFASEGWLKGLLFYNDSSEGWGLYGKPAGTVLQQFAATRTAPLLNMGAQGYPPALLRTGPIVSAVPEALKEGTTYEPSTEHDTDVTLSLTVPAGKYVLIRVNYKAVSKLEPTGGGTFPVTFPCPAGCFFDLYGPSQGWSCSASNVTYQPH